MNGKRSSFKFIDLFYPEPDAKFRKIKAERVEYDEASSDWFYVNKGGSERRLIGNYFQDFSEILHNAGPGTDYSQGLDYHYYILQDLYVYELKKPNIQKTCDPSLHNSCLENRLSISKLTQLNNEYIDYLLFKSRKPIKSIYKKIATNYDKVRPQNFKYTELDDSDDEEFARLVINGMDSDFLYNRIISTVNATYKFVDFVQTHKKSTYSFASLLHVYIELFDPSVEILWKYIVLSKDQFHDKMNTNDVCVRTLYNMTHHMLQHFISKTVKFSEFCDTLSSEMSQKMSEDFEYQMPLCFTVTAPTLMAVSSFLRNVIPIKCLRVLLTMMERFLLQKFVSDLNPDAYYVQFKTERNR